MEGHIHGILWYFFLFLDTFVLLFQNGVSTRCSNSSYGKQKK